MAVKIWRQGDVPTVEEARQFLDMVQAIRNVFPAIPGLPPVPPDLDRLTFEEANDIERILARVDWAADSIANSRVYSGEFTSGGV